MAWKGSGVRFPSAPLSGLLASTAIHRRSSKWWDYSGRGALATASDRATSTSRVGEVPPPTSGACPPCNERPVGLEWEAVTVEVLELAFGRMPASIRGVELAGG